MPSACEPASGDHCTELAVPASKHGNSTKAPSPQRPATQDLRVCWAVGSVPQTQAPCLPTVDCQLPCCRLGACEVWAGRHIMDGRAASQMPLLFVCLFWRHLCLLQYTARGLAPRRVSCTRLTSPQHCTSLTGLTGRGEPAPPQWAARTPCSITLHVPGDYASTSVAPVPRAWKSPGRQNCIFRTSSADKFSPESRIGNLRREK